MGNSCSAPSKNNFSGEGRTLGSTPVNPPQTASQPHAALPSEVSQETHPRAMTAAGLAAQERMSKNAATGKLGQKLEGQKKQTRNDTLKAVSAEEQGFRNAQSNAEARNWN